jgi:hypothetical protein
VAEVRLNGFDVLPPDVLQGLRDRMSLKPAAPLTDDAEQGLRIETPFGLIRVDLGYQLNRIEGLRIGRQPERHRWRIDIGVGEAF